MDNFGKTLIIVPCGKKKIWNEKPSSDPILAQYAYTSNYFKICVQYAEKFSDKWVIFSGKYGLIEPNFMIGNYDIRVKAKKEIKNKIKEQLKPFISEGFSSFVSLCGEDYSQVLKDVIDFFGIRFQTPLKGLKIGMKQKTLKGCLESGTSLK